MSRRRLLARWPAIAFFVSVISHVWAAASRSASLRCLIVTDPSLQERVVLRFRFLLPLLGLVLVAVLYASYVSRSQAALTPPSFAAAHVVAPRVVSDVRAGTAEVRFVNAMPGSPPLEFRHGDSLIVSNVVFGAVSPYRAFADGERTFTVRGQAEMAADAVAPTNLLDGERYTVLAMSDSTGRSTLHVVLDELHPDPGRARVRVINAAAVHGEVVVRLRGGDAPFMSAVHGTGVAEVRDVLPTTTGFSLRDRGDHTLATVTPLTLAEGVSYTIVVAARKKGETTAITIVDHAGELRDQAILARE